MGICIVNSKYWFILFDCFGDMLIGNQLVAGLTLAKDLMGDHFAHPLVIGDELGESHLK
jgi:hypothetical protein